MVIYYIYFLKTIKNVDKTLTTLYSYCVINQVGDKKI